MAQKEKYTEDQLMDAVGSYAEVYHGKIKVSDLARWASKNIVGMEGVQAHNFRGKRKIHNPRTGKLEERTLKAFDRIQEINSIRAGTSHLMQNVFLYASNPDAYLRLPRTEQRRQILEARAFVERTISKDKTILRENDVIRKENEQLKEENRCQDRLLADIQSRQEVLDRHLRMVIKEIEATEKAEMLRSYGVMDGGFDLVAYQASLRLDIGKAFSVSETIRNFIEKHSEKDEEGVQGTNDRIKLIDTITGGLEI